MVLVDDSSGIAGNFDSVQDQIYEMVEQTPEGKEQRTAWEMGGMTNDRSKGSGLFLRER